MTCRKVCILIIILIITSQYCNGDENQDEIVIFSSTILNGVVDDLKQQYAAKNPGVMIIINSANAGMLENQIREGADSDLFLSASRDNIDNIMTAGLLDPRDVSVFAKNSLAILVPRENPKNILQISDLIKPGVKLVTTVKNAPLRGYTEKLLENAEKLGRYNPDIRKKFEDNIIIESPSASGAIHTLILGEADATIGYASDISPVMQKDILVIPLPDDIEVYPELSLGILKNSTHREKAQEFVDLLMSEKGDEILIQYGFIPVSRKS
ncbi:molybdate ABC transporter substrate-binding protein [Methanospirillum hungatei]|uniref:molybdate ABC transporter substrate-binding protein n=1 Tax=Methanospirillum hungatei TaxID=2203 RepID=UPI0026E9EB64|nr:molybdate ABC transporter substrate-binding protein [Methanospirillum hungatei]MCA1916152.1 molybdate ABC transporter substrate-binding protein [Methanospirillum hungatei]